MLDSINVTGTVANEDVMLEVEDVMKILKCSRAAVSRYMRNDGLPYVKLGKKKNAHLRFRLAAFREWLKEQEIIEPVRVVN